MPYDVNPETCAVIECEHGRLGSRSVALLLAYHLAGEKSNHWSTVKNEAWNAYAEAVAKSQEGGLCN